MGCEIRTLTTSGTSLSLLSCHLSVWCKKGILYDIDDNSSVKFQKPFIVDDNNTLIDCACNCHINLSSKARRQLITLGLYLFNSVHTGIKGFYQNKF